MIKMMQNVAEQDKFANVRYVFLDRDGVINRKPPEGKYIAKWDDFHILPGAEKAIAMLNHSGRKAIIISNQRGIALGLYSKDDVLHLHEKLNQHLTCFNAHLDAIYFCPHDRNECRCRKPGTALFEQAFLDFPSASSHNSVMIGDSLSDIEAGITLGMPTIFIKGDPKHQKPGAEKAASLATAVADSLLTAVEQFLL
ncbi:MAG TPA: HAD-IIIA family hydrolase [Pseudacidobacterium sp.]|nr:HAD-IIIA family hydrolase [Pseudacidobacterium sp.]